MLSRRLTRMTTHQSDADADGSILLISGLSFAILGAIPLIFRWFANGYPDGFCLLTAILGMVAFAGCARRTITAARRPRPAALDDSL